MTEKAIVNTICGHLKRLGIYHLKTHGNPYERAGRLDLIVVVRGHHFEFEVKTPDGKVTPLQEHRIREVRRAGARACVVYSWANVRACIEEHFGADISDLTGPM